MPPRMTVPLSTLSDEELQSLFRDGSNANSRVFRKELEHEMKRLEVELIVSLVRSGAFELPPTGFGPAGNRDQNSESGVSMEALNTLPTRKFKPSSKLEGTAKQCVVCMKDYAPGDTLRILPCIHSFCKGCIDEWLVHNPCCPCCKHPAFAADNWTRVCHLPGLLQSFCFSMVFRTVWTA